MCLGCLIFALQYTCILGIGLLKDIDIILVLILYMWGELASHPPQFSTLGIQVSGNCLFVYLFDLQVCSLLGCVWGYLSNLASVLCT